jgi:hypothetical protein
VVMPHHRRGIKVRPITQCMAVPRRREDRAKPPTDDCVDAEIGGLRRARDQERAVPGSGATFTGSLAIQGGRLGVPPTLRKGNLDRRLARANSRRRGVGNACPIGTSCNDWNESGTNRGRIGDSPGCAQPVGLNASTGYKIR